MTKLTQKITKGTLGTVAAGAMALATASPALADRGQRDRGVDAGDVIAGAVIVGGIAALAGAFNKKDRYPRDRHYRGDGYRGNHHNSGYANNRGGGQRAIERCIRVAERQARRFGGYHYADVTQIRDVEQTRYGWRVKGQIEVQGQRGGGYSSRSYGANQSYDRGKFTCYFDHGNRPQIDFRSIRGL